MAINGIGYRKAWQVMLEMSFTMIEPFCFTTLTSTVAAGLSSPTVASLGIPVNALYSGALIIIDAGGPNEEIVEVLAVNVPASSFTAAFAFAHAVGTRVVGVTFPSQAESGDPFFSQDEILSYIARAQNEFLCAVPLVFQLNVQQVQPGQIYQPLPCDTIETAHFSASSLAVQISSLNRSSGTVTAVSASPHGLSAGRKFSIFNCPDPSFDGAFATASVISPTSWTYRQVQPDASVLGGTLGLWKRLYETSQTELTMQNPGWRSQHITTIRSFFEDRTGNYKFGVDGIPAASIPMRLLVSIRDTDKLSLDDGFLVPDILLHYVKYRALQYVWEKDGEQRDPVRARYCAMRYERGVNATRRLMAWLGADIVSAGVQEEVMTQ